MNYSERGERSFARIWFLAFVFASVWIVPILLFERRAAWLVLIPLIGSIATIVFYQARLDFAQFANALRLFWLAGIRRTVGTVTANSGIPRAAELGTSYSPSKTIAELLDKREGFPRSWEAEYFQTLANDLRVIDIADLSPQAAIEFSKLTFTLITLRAKYLEALERQDIETHSLWTAPNWYEVLKASEHEEGTKLSVVEINKIKKLVGVQAIYLQDLLNLMRVEYQWIEKTARR